MHGWHRLLLGLSHGERLKGLTRQNVSRFGKRLVIHFELQTQQLGVATDQGDHA